MSLTKSNELLLVVRTSCRSLRRRSTQAERMLWRELRDRRFMGVKFRRQHPILHDLPGRKTFFIVDFYCAEVKLALELDGGIHIGKKEEDQARTDILNLLGISVLRFTNQTVEENMGQVLDDIRRTTEHLVGRTRRTQK